MTATSVPIKGLKADKRRRKARKQDLPIEPVRLSFDTQRIFSAKQARPVGHILFNASEAEQLSYQPTVPVETKRLIPELQKGATIMNKVGKHDFLKTQAATLFAISGMGLLIGFFIAYFI